MKVEELSTRPGTQDRYTVNEAWTCYRALSDLEGAHVLDLGANLGAFVLWVRNHGARRVVSIEPDQQNFSLLCANTTRFESQVNVRAAVVPQDNPGSSAVLYRREGFDGEHRLKPHPGWGQQTVPAISLPAILEKYGPFDVVKCDIEGGEYGIGLELLPPSVRQLALELHFSERDWRKEAAPHLLSGLAAAGWQPVLAPKIRPWRRTTVGIWARP